MSFVGAVPFARTRFDLRTTTLTRLMGAMARASDTTLEWRERARQRRRLAALDARMLARHRHHPGGGAQRGGKALLAAVTPRVRLPRAIRAAYKGRCSRSALSRVLTPNP